MATKEKIGEGFKFGAGQFKVYLVGKMKYEIRNGHEGPVVDVKPNLGTACTAAIQQLEASKAPPIPYAERLDAAS